MKYGLVIILAALFYSCANVVAPTGGPIDKTAPLWDKSISIPDSSNNTNFDGEEIVLYFDEPIDVKNFQKEIISNPDINSKIDYKLRKKRVHFQFTEPLDSNTTYVINFGNSIIDITESNPAKNIIVAFSTGPKIDSLKVMGNVINNFTQKPYNNVTVGLYLISDTLDITKHKPKYYTKSRTNGSFQFNYIKHGSYKIFAFDDKNDDKLYNQYKESVGFIDNILDLNENEDSLQFNLFKEIKDTLYIKSIKRQNDHVAVSFSRGIKKYQVKPINTKIVSQYDIDQNTLKLFTNDTTVEFSVSVEDSLGNMVDSTSKVENFEAKVSKTVDLINKSLSTDYQLVNNKIKANISFLTPLESIIYDSIDIIQGTDTLRSPKDSLFSLKLDDAKLNLNIESKFIYKDSLQIVIRKGALKNIYGSINKEQKIEYLRKNPKRYGVFSGKIKTDYKNYIFQLVVDNKVVEEQYNITSFYYKDLKPGLYTFRIIKDDNSNQIYDTGRLIERIKPELVYYHTIPIQLKANWEITDLVIDTNN